MGSHEEMASLQGFVPTYSTTIEDWLAKPMRGSVRATDFAFGLRAGAAQLRLAEEPTARVNEAIVGSPFEVSVALQTVFMAQVVAPAFAGDGRAGRGLEFNQCSGDFEKEYGRIRRERVRDQRKTYGGVAAASAVALGMPVPETRAARENKRERLSGDAWSTPRVVCLPEQARSSPR